MSADPTDIQRPDAPPEGFSLSGDAMQAMFASVAADTVDHKPGILQTLRALPTLPRTLLVVIVQVVVVGAGIQLQGVRTDISLVALPLLTVLLLAVAAVGVALRPMGKSSTSASRIWPWLLGIPVLISVPAVWPGVFMGFWEAMPMHIKCSWRALLIAAIATVPFVVVERHGLMRRWSLLTAAGSAGAVAFVVQVATCPLATLEHRIVAHGSAGILIAMVLVVAVWTRQRLRQ